MSLTSAIDLASTVKDGAVLAARSSVTEAHTQRQTSTSLHADTDTLSDAYKCTLIVFVKPVAVSVMPHRAGSLPPLAKRNLWDDFQFFYRSDALHVGQTTSNHRKRTQDINSNQRQSPTSLIFLRLQT